MYHLILFHLRGCFIPCILHCRISLCNQCFRIFILTKPEVMFMSRVGEDFTIISSNAEALEHALLTGGMSKTIDRLCNNLQQTLSGYDIHSCPAHRIHYTRNEAFRLLITAYLAIDSYTDLARVSKEFGYLLEI